MPFLSANDLPIAGHIIIIWFNVNITIWKTKLSHANYFHNIKGISLTALETGNAKDDWSH